MGKSVASSLPVNTLTSSAKAVVVYGTGGLAGAGTSVPTAIVVGGGTGATVGTLEVANNRANAAIEGTEYQGTFASDTGDVLFSAGTGALVAGAFQLTANTLRAGMEGYAQGSLPSYNGTQTQGTLVTNRLDYVRLQSGGADPRYSNYPAASHVEGKGAINMRESGASEGSLFQNNTGGICKYCDTNVPTLLPPGARMNVTSPPGAVPKNRHSIVEPKTYIGNDKVPKPRVKR